MSIKKLMSATGTLLLVLAAAHLAQSPAHAASSSSPAFLIYRTYLPSAGAASVPLPSLVYSYSDGRAPRTLPPCAKQAPMPSVSPMAQTVEAQGCAWIFTVSGADGSSGLNIAYPDTASTYWVMPFVPDAALTISIKGQYPDARYISFNVYDSSGSSFVSNGVGSGLADYLIAPDTGSVNPWQQSAPSGGGYTLQVSSAAAPGQSNVLPMPPASNAVPTGLPPTCKGSECPPLNQFQRESLKGLFPNVDNAYVNALTQPQKGEVLVIRGKLPNSIIGPHPKPWPTQGVQLRYWSICSNLYLLPYPVNSCLTDDQMVPDAQGYYTVVASSAADRPRNATHAHGVGWLQYSKLLPNARQMMIVRNMLPNQFDEAIQHVEADSGPQGAQSVMQDYYPQAWTCTKATFENGGWQACAK